MTLLCSKPNQTQIDPDARHTNNLAATCNYSDLSRRLPPLATYRLWASALGTYRFWRDIGYAVVALVTGTCGNWSLSVKTSLVVYQETGEECRREKLALSESG